MIKTEVEKFTDILRQHGVSLTKPRLAIFEALLAADHPLKNGEIAKLVPSIDRTSVYRSLELFTELGITETIVRGWTPLTELAEPFRAHHHHMTCEQCMMVIEIENDVLEEVLGRITKTQDFLPTRHTVEITGICASCQRA